MTDPISADLRMKSNIINMGERIAWGSETGLMDAAADHIDAQAATIKALVEALYGFKHAITKAALDSESGHTIVDTCFSAHCDAAKAAAKEPT